ncbi:BTB and MATH domain-containing protein 40-like [Anticarsia gemmatalis]|uniref:BTB and MATH domain-containing protein 40-like n=1 Tax=Anticarsia gemmatalis TaxID=129554 RepID=UPI003F76DC5A
MMSGNPVDLFLRRGIPRSASNGQEEPSSPPPEANKAKAPLGYVSAVHRCQTGKATKIVIYDACAKIINGGEYDIGGTYLPSQDPELWFFFTVSLCHGKNRLVNLFVCHRNIGAFSIQVPMSGNVTQKTVPEHDVPILLLPSDFCSPLVFKSTKPNQNFFIKSFSINCDLTQFHSASTMVIPVKIEMNPKFILDDYIVKSIKLQHDLSSLLTKQEKTDFFLESSTNKKFPTHKILLAAHSPVLRNMIKDSKLTSLFIDLNDSDMELLIEFIYTGTIKDVMNQDCLKLLEIADKFKLKPLFMLIQHVIGDQISVTNAVEMAVIAKKYELTELQNKVFDFIIKNPEVMKTDAWMNLKDVELTKYLFQYMHTMRD